MLASLARGLQGGSYEVSRGGKNELEKKVKLDLETVACGLGHEKDGKFPYFLGISHRLRYTNRFAADRKAYCPPLDTGIPSRGIS